MKSPYDILGVAPTASADDIRRAYHRLAKTNHPDTNPDKKDAAEKFAAISSAHTVLADPEKRARFDRGEIDATYPLLGVLCIESWLRQFAQR